MCVDCWLLSLCNRLRGTAAIMSPKQTRRINQSVASTTRHQEMVLSWQMLWMTVICRRTMSCSGCLTALVGDSQMATTPWVWTGHLDYISTQATRPLCCLVSTSTTQQSFTDVTLRLQQLCVVVFVDNVCLFMYSICQCYWYFWPLFN